MKVSENEFVKEIVDRKKLIEYQTRSYREDIRESILNSQDNKTLAFSQIFIFLIININVYYIF